MNSLFLTREPLLVEGLTTLLSKKVSGLSLNVVAEIEEEDLLGLTVEKGIDLFVLDTVSYRKISTDLVKKLRAKIPSLKIIFIYDIIS